MQIKLSGEYFIPGHFEKRIEDEHLERYRFAQQFMSNNVALDVACGVGYGTHLLSQANPIKIDGVDVGAAMIEYAKQHYSSKLINFFEGDITNFGLNESYDVITSFETIEHVQDYHAALNNLYRILKPGGKLIISTPNRPMSWRPVKTIHDKPRNPYHVREFELTEFVEALKEHQFIVKQDSVLGQRQYRYISNRYFRKIYSILFRPEDRSSAKVQLIQPHTKPKYVVIVAQKPQ